MAAQWASNTAGCLALLSTSKHCTTSVIGFTVKIISPSYQDLVWGLLRNLMKKQKKIGIKSSYIQGTKEDWNAIIKMNGCVMHFRSLKWNYVLPLTKLDLFSGLQYHQNGK